MSAFYSLSALPWDSDFFGKRIGKMDIREVHDHADEINRAIEDSFFELIYCFSPEEQGLPEQISSLLTNAMWVDGKVTYSKNVALTTKVEIDELFSATEISEELCNLSLQAGVFSRFNTDQKFEKHYYQELYRRWIERSVSREIADEVLVYCSYGEILGMITIGTKGERADIGLVSVDSVARGKGVATKLLQGAERYAAKRGFETIQVVTQQQNLPACRLYEKYGFRKESLVNIFHIWKS